MAEGGASAAAAPVALSGEKITLISKSGGKYEVAREVAQQSQLIRNIISTTDNDGSEGGSVSGSGGSEEGASGNTEVPVRVVEDDILAKVIQFMSHHHGNPMADIEKPIPSDNMEDIATDPFDRVSLQCSLVVLSDDTLCLAAAGYAEPASVVCFLWLICFAFARAAPVVPLRWL
eukprot:INCI3986.2.p3 GENE.INCI3986.2~~INCI3986.2.p3  ORF type:complete len:175 (-),score=32.51 INCI3986.2:383-907(-)